ncbi:MAG: hypothetical protein CL677_08690 [Bdellovibrionaceae bacterium]|nr:hypothetical protein [Pseudobdellovibrionaceae bacterium]|tara:strand:- start:10902 stop:11984 length:1083 start_codon:yes stop_codon:yes gene_type:complete
MTSRIKSVSAWIAAMALSLSPSTGIPCSAFYGESGSQSVMGKSYDWHMSHGYLIANKRNVEKSSLLVFPTDNRISWTSEYGSVTFNQYGHEFPLGGINEAGMAIEVLWLNSSEYPDDSHLQSLNELQWIQYHLDTSANVPEMIERARQVRISPVVAEVHYLACDANSDCAVFEYLNGELVIHSTTSLTPAMEAPSITNNTYARSMEYARNFVSFGGSRPIPTGSGSLDRFVRASYVAKSFANQKSIDSYFFDILDSVATGSFSKWNIVYELDEKVVHFVPRYTADRARVTIRLDDMNFDCSSSVQARRLASHDGWTAENQFSNMSTSKNRTMVNRALEGDIPGYLVNQVINYPNTTRCRN